MNKRTLLVCSLALGVYFGHTWLYLDFFIDDAFISLRYVQQWLAGNGLVYNIGERVEGYSNFLWIVLVWISGVAGTDLVLATRFWGIGFSVVTLVSVCIYVRQLPMPWISPLLLSLSTPFVTWSVGGLENPLFMFLVLTGTLLFITEERKGNGWYSGICWGLLPLVRPDGALFGVIAFIYRVRTLYQLRQFPQLHDYLRGFTFLLLPGLHIIWRIFYYGYPLPNTYYAKSVPLTLRTLMEGGYYTFLSLESIGGFFFVGLLLFFAFRARRTHQYVNYLVANVLAYMAFIVLAGGDWMPGQRFLASILPVLVILLHVGAGELFDWFDDKFAQRTVGVLLACQLVYFGVSALNDRFIEVGITNRLSGQSAWIKYLTEHSETTDTIAVEDAGKIAYQMPLSVRIIDMVGLADSHIAHQAPEFPGGLLGRGDAWGRWDPDYVLEQNPRYVKVNLSPGYSNSDDWIQTNFTGTTLLVNDERFRARYQPTSIQGLFERVPTLTN